MSLLNLIDAKIRKVKSGESLAVAISKASPGDVVLISPGSYTVNTAIEVPAGVHIYAYPGVTVSGTGTGTGDNCFFKLLSGCSVQGITFDLTDIATGGAILIGSTVVGDHQEVSDVSIEHCRFINASPGKLSITHTNSAYMTNILINDCDLSGIQPISFIADQIDNVVIINNRQREVIPFLNSCTGFFDVSLTGSSARGLRIIGNHVEVTGEYTSDNPNAAPYGISICGDDVLMADNDITYIVNHVTPDSPTSPGTIVGIAYNDNGISADTLRPIRLMRNSIRIIVTGATTGTNDYIAALGVSATNGTTAIPTIECKGNQVIISTDQSSQPTSRRCKGAQTYASTNGVIMLPADGLTGLGTTDALTRLSVSALT